MRSNLTETHIAGIAAAVLAIVIIVAAVALMNVAQPPDDGGNSTLSPAVGSMTESPETHTPGFTPAPTSTPEQTTAPTDGPPSTEPPPEDNEGIDPSKVSVTPKCTDANGEAWYELRNENPETATISFSSTGAGTSDSIAVQGGGGSAEISVPVDGDNAALVIEFPGIDDGTHDGVRHPPASKACNGGSNGTATETDDGTPTETDTEDTPSPTITFSDQTSSNGKTVVVDQMTLPDGGFIVLSPEGGSQTWPSPYVDPGTKTDQPIDLPQQIDGEQTFTATIYRDTNGNGEYDGADKAYTVQGSPVSDTATVTAENGGGNGNDGDDDDGGLFGRLESV